MKYNNINFTYNEWCKVILCVWEDYCLDYDDADADVTDWYPLNEAVQKLNYVFESIFGDGWNNKKMRNLAVSPSELFDLMPSCVQIFDLLRENFEYFNILKKMKSKLEKAFAELNESANENWEGERLVELVKFEQSDKHYTMTLAIGPRFEVSYHDIEITEEGWTIKKESSHNDNLADIMDYVVMPIINA